MLHQLDHGFAIEFGDFGITCDQIPLAGKFAELLAGEVVLKDDLVARYENRAYA